MKQKQTFWLGLTALLLWTGCATNPVTGRSELQMLSEAQEIAIGTENFGHQIQMQGGIYRLDPEINRYVEQLGHQLARVSDRPHLPYEFVVLNDSSWNAWAMPGGKIAINRGLLKVLDNESELAAVLAHEIVHAAARHSAQQMEREIFLQVGVAGVSSLVGPEYRTLAETAGGLGTGLALLRYSRTAETEADFHSIRYMTRAGIDPVGAVTLQEKFAENEGSAGGWLASHPASVERVRRNRDSLERGGPGKGRIGEVEYRVRTRTLRAQAPAYELYDEGVEQLEDNPREALRLAREAIRLLPGEALFHGLGAQAHMRLNNPAAALESWNQAIARNPDWFLFWLERGLLLEQAGRKADARRDLERSFELLPTQAAREAIDRL